MILIPSMMGRLNQQALLDRLQQLGAASRADLAKSLGVSQPTAGKIVDQFIALGVLEEQGCPAWPLPPNPETPRSGRPGRLVRLNQTARRFLGIQLGVSQTNLAPLALVFDGEDRWQVDLPTPDSPAAWARQLRRAARQLPRTDLWGVLVSVPGIVDEPAGRVLFSPNLHWTEGADLPALIREVWDVPVVLVQEERALALGHQAVSPAARDFLLVDFGEGVGGAIVVAGGLYPSPLPTSGEIGHTPVPGNTRRCGCGAIGCLETLISRRGLLESFAVQPSQPSAAWEGLAASLNKPEPPAWIVASLDAAAAGIAEALNILGLPRVVITGSFAELPPPVFRYLAHGIQQGCLWSRYGRLECELAPRRRTTGLVAAGLSRLIVPLAGGDRQAVHLLRAQQSRKGNAPRSADLRPGAVVAGGEGAAGSEVAAPVQGSPPRLANRALRP
jgi:predicted NBD/HSP70 family sugar kinase